MQPYEVGEKKASLALVVAVCTMLGLVVTACSSPVPLTFWFYVAGPNFENVKGLAEEFNQEHADIQVETVLESGWSQKLPVTIAAGVPPDVVWMNWISVAAYAHQGVLVNLQEIMKREGKLEAYSRDFFPALWETSKHEGSAYCLPFDTNNMLMFYNRDILNQYGVADPPENWTWDDFIRQCKKIASPPDRYAFSTVNDWRHFIDFLGAAGGRVLSADGKQVTINKPEAVEALQFMVDILHTYQIAPMPTGGWQTGFANGLLGFEVQGSYRLPQYATLGTTNLGAVAQPQRKARYSSAGGESVVIVKTNPQREAAAWRFVDWMTNTEANAKWSAISGYLPVRRSSMAHKTYQQILRGEPLRRLFAEELTYGDRLPTVPTDRVFGILGSMVGKAVNQSVTVNQAIADAETDLKAALGIP
ncbi:MAG: ABC transporter substrate-binding protein [Limnochordia bacterium]|jgi:ABC-type glycerol-3-phosphate transport system substrate-binding protein